MQTIKAPDVLVRSVGQKMADLIHKVSGSKKRYDNMLLSIYQFRNLFKEFTHENFAEIISRKLKSKEGLILSHSTYGKLFGYSATELDVEDLQKYFSKKGLSVVPVYKKLKEDQPPIAVFLCVHHEQYIALEIYEELREILTGKKKTENAHSQFIKAAIKVSEEIGKMNEKQGQVYAQDIYDAVQLLSDNEVYMVSITYCIEHRIDPKKLDELLSNAGFKVLVLMKDIPSTETNEMYKYYDSLLGLAISREDSGLELAKSNMKVLFTVCEAAESGLPKAAVQMTGANHV